tara:strand:+ start:157 stop:480 length:324 start_codon:yes stop_codon:yes gene_type:complete
MEYINAKEFKNNPTLEQTIEPDTDLKNIFVEYVGGKLNPEDQNVTVEMLVEVMADEFPEFVLALAEENFLRGYEQGLEDVEAGIKLRMSEKETCSSEKKRSCKLCEE